MRRRPQMSPKKVTMSCEMVFPMRMSGMRLKKVRPRLSPEGEQEEQEEKPTTRTEGGKHPSMELPIRADEER